MALQTRLFVEKGPSDAAIQSHVSPTAQATERYRSPVCLIQYEDSEPGILETLDEYMDGLGYDALGGNLVVDVFERPGNPAAAANRILLYARLEAGVLQLFARGPGGVTTQLTPLQLAAGAVNGLVPAWTSGTTITIGAGSCRDVNDARNIVLAAPQLVNGAVVGANGIDVGALANSTWYYIFVISDSTGVLPTAGLISTVSGVPTMPAGYDTRRRIGSARTDGAASFRNFQVDGTQRHRSVQYRDSINNRQRLTNGAAQVVTAVNLGQNVPNTSSYARLQVQQKGPIAANLYDDPTQALNSPQRTVLANGALCDVMRCSAGRDIAYANQGANGSLDIWVTGYEEDL